MVVDDSALFHARTPYDPRKAHEYYLRTRHLRGRNKGVVQTPVHTRQPGTSAVGKRRTAQAEVAKLEARLAMLKAELAKLVEKAKARSGIETKPTTSKSSSSSKTSSTKTKTSQDSQSSGSTHKTAAQKRKDAKRAHDNYEKTKDTLQPVGEVARLKKQIEDIRQQIKDAIAKALEDSTKPKGRPVVPTQRRHDKAVDTMKEGASQNGRR